MSRTVIRVENLSKEYRLGTIGGHTLRDEVQRGWARLRGQPNPLLKIGQKDHGNRQDETIWALRDVNLQVKEGEILGIIGRNGAGKSTLLKILSRITAPTAGAAKIKGRVGNLLEVGTGFHPELTGRENIYLNGSILGMRKSEVDWKLDEIIDFSGIETYIDTPVKRYSSGMHVRLAFAVAAHLEPEILLVDEVLAVGDARFQRKCLGKMNEVANRGQCILFVSHNMGAVRDLCTRSIIIHSGFVKADGPTDDVIADYLDGTESASSIGVSERTDRTGSGRLRLKRIESYNPEAAPRSPLFTGCPVRFDFYLDKPARDVHVHFGLYDQFGHLVADFNSRQSVAGDNRPDQETSIVTCEVDELILVPGRYSMNVQLYFYDQTSDYLQSATVLDIGDGVLRGRPVPRGTRGTTAIPHLWTFR